MSPRCVWFGADIPWYALSNDSNIPFGCFQRVCVYYIDEILGVSIEPCFGNQWEEACAEVLDLPDPSQGFFPLPSPSFSPCTFRRVATRHSSSSSCLLWAAPAGAHTYCSEAGLLQCVHQWLCSDAVAVSWSRRCYLINFKAWEFVFPDLRE